MRIEQALHGYDEGHRQLATSAKLTLDEERTLDLLSDLSGYLPPGTRFDSYETGYPCGRFYVYARTWPDWTGQRSGTVLTHSLLLPRETCSEVHSLAALDSFFQFPRQPIDRKIRETYQRVIDWNPIRVSDPLLSPRARRMVAAIWFGQDIRPILWTDSDTGTNAQRLLWSWLPPWHRAQHSFCTFAIQPRYMGPKLFDFLVLAKGGDSAFYSLRDRIIRCDGQQASPHLERLLEAEWLNDLVDGSSEKTQTIWHDSLDWGIPQLDGQNIKVYLLYRDFRKRSESHFAAAVTRIDLLHKLAPNPDQATDEKNAALWKCLELARKQPPDKYIDVALDILERHPKQFAPALSAEVENFLIKAQKQGRASSPDKLVRVYSMAVQMGFAEAAREGILAALHSPTDEDAAAWAARYQPIVLSLVSAQPKVLATVLTDLSTDRRRALGHQLLTVADTAVTERFAPLMLDIAESAQDFALLQEITSTMQPQALLRTLHRIVETDPALDNEQVAQILARIESKNVMEWLAYDCADVFIAERLAHEIAKTLPDSDEGKSLLQSALPGAGGIAVLVELCAIRSQATISRILDENAATYTNIFHLAKQFPERKGFDKLLPIVIKNCDTQSLLDHFDCTHQEKWQNASWAGTIANRLVMVLIRQYLEGSVGTEALQAWLSSPHATHWLQRQHRLELRDEFEKARGENIGRAMALLQTPNFAFLRNEPTFVTRCLETWGRQPLSVLVPLVPQWTAFLKSLEDQRTFVGACMVSLRIALSRHTRDLAPLAEVAFAPAHDGLYASSPHRSWAIDFILDLLGEDWDRAKQVRKGLARAWLHGDWHPLSLLRAAQGRGSLFMDLADEVLKENGGKRALRRLVREARNAPDADPRWNGMLDWLPAKVRSDD